MFGNKEDVVINEPVFQDEDDKLRNRGNDIEFERHIETSNSKLHTDVALSLYKESLSLDPARSYALSKRVRRKLDTILLPMVCSMTFVK